MTEGLGSRNVERIACVIAMQAEATPFAMRLGLRAPETNPFDERLPIELLTGRSGGIEVALVRSGTDARHGVDNIGTQPATLSSYLAVQWFHPDLVINAGTAGGFGHAGCQLFDTWLSRDVLSFHDRRITIEAMPGFAAYGRGEYPVLDVSRMSTDLGFKTGRISTGDSFDVLDADLLEMKRSGAGIKEMEAAAVAWVCHLLQTPVVALKVITDLMDLPVHHAAQFASNYRKACEIVADSLEAVLAYCQDKTLADLGESQGVP